MGVDGEVEKLIQKLKDINNDWHVRRDAAKSLGMKGDKSAVPALIETSLKDEYPSIRRMAIWALGRIGDPEAVNVLISIMLDNFERDKNNMYDLAYRTLVKMGKSAVPELIDVLETRWKDRRRRIRYIAIKALGDIREPEAIPELIDRLYYRDDYEDAAKALVKMGKLAVPGLIQIVKSENEFVRYGAVKLLVEIGDPRASRAFIEALGDSRVRERALQGLKNMIDHKETVRALREALRDITLGYTVRKLVAELLKHREDAQKRRSGGSCSGVGEPPQHHKDFPDPLSSFARDLTTNRLGYNNGGPCTLGKQNKGARGIFGNIC